MATVALNRLSQIRYVVSALLSFVVLIISVYLLFIGDKIEQVLMSLVILLSGGNIVARFGEMAKARANPKNLPSKTKFRTAEDRLDELERLKRRDMVTPGEYTAKRQEILKDL